MMFPSVMIIDDEPSIRQSLSGLLSDEGFEVTTASNGYEALKIIDSDAPDLALLDIWMPGIDGIETLKEIKKENPFIQVVIITGHGTIETAVKATKLGAYDFIEKPLSIDKILVTIHNALNFRRLEEENKYLRKKMIEKHSINGNSLPVLALKKQIATAAPTDKWILITGENGSGKELVARTIHQFSPRANQPMVDVNCAAIPDGRMETELFGQEKGAFAEDPARKRGKFELASSGTLFLDEIGDMSLKTQAKMLRMLEEQKFQRVAGGRTISVDVRIISSTNKEIEKEIEKGNFREDLYYRLNVIPIRGPPLRERSEDIPVLVETFLDECVRLHHCKKKRMTRNALKMLSGHSWPGNVRELKNLVSRLAIMLDKEIIEASDIPPPYHPAPGEGCASVEAKLFFIDHLEEAKETFEREFIQRKLLENENDMDRTAGMIGVERSYLERKMRKWMKRDA